ncbi:MAG: hypothetical protein MJZ14_06355 [Paludibacteraceae bacterium]|nr:hypothetical protein [Paludibacteraceae bacterium]
MKKVLFISAAVLALLASSCKKEAKVETPAEATVETVENVAEQAATVVESAASQEINAALAAIKAAAESATKEDVASLVAKLTEIKAQFESKASEMSEDEQSAIKTVFNEIADLVKSKNN